MATAKVSMEPDTVKLQAFTIEMSVMVVERSFVTPDGLDKVLTTHITDPQLRQNAVVAIVQAFKPNQEISGNKVTDVLRNLAAGMRQGAKQADEEFKNRLKSREDRRARRGQRAAGSRKSSNFTGDDFPGIEAFGLPPAPPGLGQPPLIQEPAPDAGSSPLPPYNGAPATAAAIAPPQAPVDYGQTPVAEREFNDDSL